jgi:hypothetical protein
VRAAVVGCTDRVQPLSPEYVAAAVSLLKMQLSVAGLRLADVLNRSTLAPTENPSLKAAMTFTYVVGGIFLSGCVCWVFVLRPLLRRQMDAADGGVGFGGPGRGRGGPWRGPGAGGHAGARGERLLGHAERGGASVLGDPGAAWAGAKLGAWSG